MAIKLFILSMLVALSASYPQLTNDIDRAINNDYKFSNNLRNLGAIAADHGYGFSNPNIGGCADDFGCFQGYCWAKCGPGPRGKWRRGESWCYTTKSYSQSFRYVTCRQDSDCDSCWKCAGSCTM